MTDEIKKRGRGRPRKSDIAAVKPGNKGKVGRPKGDAAIINEYKSRMLASPKSRKVLETIFDAALDNDHKNQASAWKLIMDRMLPVGAFEKEVIKDAGRNSIQINISGVGAIDIADQGDNGVGSMSNVRAMSIEGEGEVVDDYGETKTTNET
tara:strand:- start:3871 stop:4326 length:456 start_codon:yes stop_codon:yes gene_type:complete